MLHNTSIAYRLQEVTPWGGLSLCSSPIISCLVLHPYLDIKIWRKSHRAVQKGTPFTVNFDLDSPLMPSPREVVSIFPKPTLSCDLVPVHDIKIVAAGPRVHLDIMGHRHKGSVTLIILIILMACEFFAITYMFITSYFAHA